MSQNYTPVEWVDETTSQQGTLINKARLDQMQTAHHYADGFEEVDTIPTADPGVSYHKVVYCTADSTFYRWNGTAWTKDVDDDTKALLDQEIARATEAEGELARDIEDEATAREQADTALGVRITGVAQDVTAEQTRATARENAIAGDLADHEADTDNPHQVTKAQVGLGNVDNTSDLAKPVSTAQQAALDLKADNSNVVNSVNGLKGTVALYPANIPMGPGQATLQQRLDVDLDLINANTEAIGQEYDERVVAIAALQASVYTKTEADTLLAGKADKATTLAGYGITDAVDTTSAQTIGGVKTFNSSGFTEIVVRSNRTSGNLGGLTYKDGNDNAVGQIYGRSDGSIVVNLLGTAKYMEIPNQRAYNASNTSDIATIGTLDGYTPMVRTSGNQDISGVKTFINEIRGHFTYDYYTGTGTNRLKWAKICIFPSTMLRFSLNLYSRFGYVVLTGSNTDMLTKTHFVTAGAQFNFTMVAETNGTYTLWVQLERNYDAYYIRDLHANRYGSELNATISTDTAVYDAPTPGASSFNSTEMAQ